MVGMVSDLMGEVGCHVSPSRGSLLHEQGSMMWPRYLRVVVTAACPMACSFCHLEGDPAGETRGGQETQWLERALRLAVQNGVRKLKFLGGEPLVRHDLPDLIRAVRSLDSSLDISLITSGAAKPEQLQKCFDAGLSRANLSIHGWTRAAFERRTSPGKPNQDKLFAWRNACLEFLIAQGRFLKLNYVYDGPEVEDDLRTFLDAMIGKNVVINLLNDLNNPQITQQRLEQVLIQMRGSWAEQVETPDPYSLPTTLLKWSDGLQVELKSSRLGEVAPWAECHTCPARARCGEGIFALRLTHLGALQLCMDRPDVRLDLASELALGEGHAALAWHDFVEQHLTGIFPVEV